MADLSPANGQTKTASAGGWMLRPFPFIRCPLCRDRHPVELDQTPSIRVVPSEVAYFAPRVAPLGTFAPPVRTYHGLGISWLSFPRAAHLGIVSSPGRCFRKWPIWQSAKRSHEFRGTDQDMQFVPVACFGTMDGLFRPVPWCGHRPVPTPVAGFENRRGLFCIS